MKNLPYILILVLILATSCVGPTWGPATPSNSLTFQTEELYWMGGSTTISYANLEQRQQLVKLVEKEFGKTYKVVSSYRPVQSNDLLIASESLSPDPLF